MNLFNLFKKKENIKHVEPLELLDISPLVQNYIDLLNKEPERFSIEYCTHTSSGYHVQVRDDEMGYSKDAWFYVRDGEYWYVPLTVAGVTICGNLADTLNKTEIRAVYHAVKNIKDKLRKESREERLNGVFGKYREGGSK